MTRDPQWHYFLLVIVISPVAYFSTSAILAGFMFHLGGSQGALSRDLILLLQRDSVYLIPLNFHAPLIFAHLACAKIRGGNFAQDRCAKFIGSRYYVSKYRQKSKLLSKKGCAKIKGTEKSAGARKLKARKLEARK